MNDRQINELRAANKSLHRDIKGYKEKLEFYKNENIRLRIELTKLKAGEIRVESIEDYNYTLANKLISYLNQKYKTDISIISRKRGIVTPRMFYYHWMSYNTSVSLKETALMLGTLHDHSTVIHARDTINDIMKYDKIVRKEYEEMDMFMNSEVKIEPVEPIINAS